MHQTIGIFGGSFDPFTLSHLRVVESCLSFFDFLWVLPCKQDVSRKEIIASDEHRWKMCELSLRHLDYPKVKLLDLEIKNGYEHTIDSVLHMKKDYHPFELAYILGQDSAETIFTWKRGDELVDSIPFYVLPRVGMPLCEDKKMWFMNSPHKYLKNFKIPHTSSSVVRDLLKDYNDLALNHLEPEVYRYIRKNRLYKESKVA